MKIYSTTRLLSLVLLITGGISGCKKADNYYEKLRLEPEIYQERIYDEVYGVGDTLTLYGRFASEQLSVNIGGVTAEIIEKTSEPFNTTYNSTMESVKVKITESMGIGEDRPVTITGSGITISGPTIVIIADSRGGILSRPITVEKIADYPAGFQPVYCNSGKGNMYFINTSTMNLIRMSTDGTRSQLPFDVSKFRDNDGTPFSITRFNGFGIDPDERYLYLSLYEQAPSRVLFHNYRLCRYDLLNGSLTVLNKTEYHIYRSMNTEAAAQPFEGNIQNVKIFAITGIYPARNGKVYFNLDGRMITALDESGNYSYKFKNASKFSRTSNNSLMDPAPQIYDAASDGYKEPSYLLGILPGNEISFARVDALDPLANGIYVSRTAPLSTGNYPRLQRYDLLNKEAGAVFNRRMVANGVSKPYSAGTFKVLNFYAGNGSTNELFGMMPLPENQVVMLKFQDLQDHEVYGKYAIPTWSVMNFVQQTGRLYAPGAFDSKGHKFNYGNDVLLNYDTQGMLYMTSDNKREILRTIYR